MKRNTIFISILLIGFVSLSAEILLTRVFSVTLNYHFAFFVISLVMFGLSLGGTSFFIFEEKILKIPAEKILYPIFILLAISFLPIILAVSNISFSFYLKPKVFLLVLILFSVCQLPFFFVGFLMSYLFMHFRKESGRVYFFDLAGASAGALFSAIAINYFGAINSLLLLGIISSIILVMNSNSKKVKVSLLILAGFILLTLINASLNAVNVTGVRNKRVDSLFTKWNSFSMVRVWGDENSLKSVPSERGISSAYDGPHPPELGMDIDAGASTQIIKFDGDFNKVEFLKYDVASFAYHLFESPNVLIIGPGGGRDVLASLIMGGKKITGVEVNPIIVNDVMKNRFKKYSGDLYGLDNIEIIVDDARSYIRNSKTKYDIIQASLVDTWAATTSGAYSLSENNLYTVEAMAEYIDHLTENGYLTISRWMTDSRKLTVLYLKAAEKLGIKNASNHLAVIKSLKIVNLIFKKSEFNKAEIEKILRLAGEMKFEILYMPSFKGQDTYSQIIDNQNLDEFISKPPNRRLRPSTDDSPFFFNRVPLGSVWAVLLKGKLNVGIFILYGLLIISSFLSLILIVVPLYINKKYLLEKRTKYSYLYLIYFSLLGIAFMLIEISFLQKFMLFLGHPTYSVTVVIFSLLVSAGIGSFLTTKINQEKLKSHLKMILLTVIGIIYLYNISLYPMFNKLLGLGINLRILISILLISMMGIFLGMPFPIGMRLLGSRHKELIPFCWSLNGVFSVLGSILALILAMNIGFTKTIFFAANLYFLAFLTLVLIKVGFKELM